MSNKSVALARPKGHAYIGKLEKGSALRNAGRKTRGAVLSIDLLLEEQKGGG
jgi:hypothetical protein